MSEPYEILETVQADVIAILQAGLTISAANIIAEQNGDLESEVERILGITKSGTGGKRGLAVIVMMPEVASAEPNLPGPVFVVKQQIQVIEHPRINRGTAGTGLRSSHAALLAMQILHHHTLGGHALYAEDKPVEPLPVKDGLISHVLTLSMQANGLTGPGKVAPVSVTEADDIITLACATAGAAIYYTTDGSYPTPTTGTLYTAPITDAVVGDTWRVAAYKTGLNPSDCLEFTITSAVVAGSITDGDFVLTDADGSVLTDP